MKVISIKTHKTGRAYLAPHLFILSKGRNSGKPLHQPCPNCFVVILQDWKHFDAFYWVAYSLWKANFWRYYLVGSVILFLRLHDFKELFQVKLQEILETHDNHQKHIETLRLLEQKEAKCNKNLLLISDMRNAILYRYIKNK